MIENKWLSPQVMLCILSEAGAVRMFRGGEAKLCNMLTGLRYLESRKSFTTGRRGSPWEFRLRADLFDVLIHDDPAATEAAIRLGALLFDLEDDTSQYDSGESLLEGETLKVAHRVLDALREVYGS